VTARDRIVLIVVAVLAACAGGYFVAVKPQRDEAAKLGEQVAAEQSRLEAAQASAATAERARGRYAKDYATVARLGKAIPADDDVASLVYQLEATAERFDIDFRDVKAASNGQAGAAAPATRSDQVAAVGAAEDGKPAEGEAAGSGTSTTPSTTPATQAAAAAAPAGTAVGTAGLPTLPFTFTFDGDYHDMRRFMAALDDLTIARKGGLAVRGRLLTLDAVSLRESMNGFPQVQAEVKATAYLVPATEGLTAGATPAGPAGATPVAGDAAGSGSSTPAPPTAAVTGGLR
jgi:Tfp pilus assembly protein PilO